MTKEEALFNLNAHINAKSIGFNGEHVHFELPINDELVCAVFKKDCIEQWTVLGLIKIAYNLTDREN
jgi:hypothetical protein